MGVRILFQSQYIEDSFWCTQSCWQSLLIWNLHLCYKGFLAEHSVLWFRHTWFKWHGGRTPHPSQWRLVSQNITVGWEKKSLLLVHVDTRDTNIVQKMLPPFLFPVFVTGRSSAPELQNSRANFDPTWGEHLRHWRWGPEQQAGRRQHLQFGVWESDASPFPCRFGPHLNQACSLPSNLFSSFLSCFQVSGFAFCNVWLCTVVFCDLFHHETLQILLNLLLNARLGMIFHHFLSGCISSEKKNPTNTKPPKN